MRSPGEPGVEGENGMNWLAGRKTVSSEVRDRVNLGVDRTSKTRARDRFLRRFEERHARTRRARHVAERVADVRGGEDVEGGTAKLQCRGAKEGL